ncbi:hypothetical protein CBER1_08018 [Cercospora berteroae]|uniref:N-acetyltransferase domain-containing protein n=1 Tax=Cercospora berteroae TaxID=357750 RepID=A0A2S6C6V3_9PEZI|nr:hypothetical protein CBER1_08018 [Cercospora berteroae]
MRLDKSLAISASPRKKEKAQQEVVENGRPRTEDEIAAPAMMNADILAGIGNAGQKVASGLKFPKNYELVFIVVEQAYRGKGLGSRLLQRGLAEVRAAGVPLCVCSEPAARPFFDKFGFVEVVHADMDLSVWAPPHTGFGVFRLTGMV